MCITCIRHYVGSRQSFCTHWSMVYSSRFSSLFFTTLMTSHVTQHVCAYLCRRISIITSLLINYLKVVKRTHKCIQYFAQTHKRFLFYSVKVLWNKKKKKKGDNNIDGIQCYLPLLISNLYTLVTNKFLCKVLPTKLISFDTTLAIFLFVPYLPISRIKVKAIFFFAYRFSCSNIWKYIQSTDSIS